MNHGKENKIPNSAQSRPSENIFSNAGGIKNMKKTGIITFLILTAGVIGSLIYLSQNNAEPEILHTGTKFQKAPNLSLKDYNGTTVTLSNFSGKIVVANAWASWCPFCVNELPDFVALQQEFRDEVVVIAINRRESHATAKGFTDKVGITDDIIFLLDPGDSFYQSIGGFGMPETLFIDGKGNIRIHKRAPMELEEMREKVESILEN